MNKTRISIAIAAVVVTASGARHCSVAAESEGSITEQELVRRMQELFDAVVPGNKEPWQKYYADDCIFSDEKGR